MEMDPFTQKMLEKAEQRSRALGISNAGLSKFAVNDNNSVESNRNAFSGACATTMASQQQQQRQQKQIYSTASIDGSSTNKNKLQVIQSKNKECAVVEPQKILRQFSAVDKENMDLGIEINIVTDKNVEVQVEVEEKDYTDDDLKENQNKISEKVIPLTTANLRDTSRNRLQRLGALYSNTDDLSSPIHRTEGKFHADTNEDELESKVLKPSKRLGKLTALASTINQWEDDISHHGLTDNTVVVHPPPKPDLPSRDNLGKVKEKSTPTTSLTKCDDKTMSSEKEKIKQLKWDPKVLTSLEAQGFQRRESSTVKVSYEFADRKDDNEEASCSFKPKETIGEEKCIFGKVNTKKFESNTSNPVSEKNNQQTGKKLPSVKSGLVLGRAAIFESQVQNSQQQQQQQKPQKDPTELSLKERMKLFEKNKGDALVPKAPFAMAPPKSKLCPDTNKKEETKVKLATSIKNPAINVPLVKSTADSKVRDKVNALVKATVENTVKEDIKRQREEDLQVLANRFNKQRVFLNNQQPTIPKCNQNSHKEKTAELPPPPPPPLPIYAANLTSKRRSPLNTIEDDKKRQRTSNQESQQHHYLYPALSNIESTDRSDSDNENNFCTTASALSTTDERAAAAHPLCNSSDRRSYAYDSRNDDEVEDSYMESEGEDSSVGLRSGSLGKQVMQVVEKNDKRETNKSKGVHYADKHSYIEDNTLETSSDASMGVDDYLDEALDEGDEDDTSHISRDSKGTTTSNSFSFRKANDAGTYEAKHVSAAKASGSPANQLLMKPVTSELTVNRENDNMVTLVHTVSFYRRQQNANSANSTPVRKVVREQKVLRSELGRFDDECGANVNYEPENNETEEEIEIESEDENEHLVQDKIKRLLDEVCKQQQVIAQTSQALNLCASTIEFSGSTESVEGERHLLVATHRRQACLDEVQRLRVEKTLRPAGAPTERGRLTIKEITIPLRQDYVRKLSLDTISGHHLVCLLKYNEQVLATKTVPTLPGLLSVKFPDILQLNNVYADFKVTLEIYGMTAQREVLPHEVKYHINFNKKSGIKTPKKKGCENLLVMPPVQSPAGPHVIRTPALVQYGFAIFSLREIQRTTWTLTQVLGVSPLDGVVHMKVMCELSVLVENRGFLTMFEDISGFGAWHRRWCHLNGTLLNYWKYPDDEKKKAPMGTIDLYTCCSQRITTAPRDICARLNTILLECQRLAKDTDKESLIIVPNGRTTIVRHLLSADTKEEREEWCAYLNKTLTLLRAWGPPQ